MLSLPSSSSYSRKSSRPARPHTPNKSPGEEFPELSDVPCYTCRRRHVKCDRILPYCAKCAKKGVPCLGYRKPLRWADAVAVRGKFKGKSQPLIDDQGVSIARDIVQQDSSSVQKEASHLGLHATHSDHVDLAINNAAFLELVNYHNAVLCVQNPGSDLSRTVVRKIASLSPEMVQMLPREILTCILGIAAVHRAVRNPGNKSIEQIALETKASLFHDIGRLFQHPEDCRADILFSCIGLMFGMDVVEHGISRWSIHFAGALKLLTSAGGTENFAFHYPHLKLILARTLHFETMQVLLFPISVDDSKTAGRKEMQTLCYDPNVRKEFFVTCPQRLLLAVYDLGECAQNIFRAHGLLSMADVYKREWILSDVLQFQPAEATRNVKECYYSDRDLTVQEAEVWNLIFTSWRCAMIIVVLRHLYFGLPNPESLTHMSRSPTPSLSDLGASQPGAFDCQFGSYLNDNLQDAGYEIEQSMEPSFETGHLQPDQFVTDPISRTPSPLHSIHGSTDDITLEFWNRRYELHNEAFSELSSTLLAVSEISDPSAIRYALMPVMILALVSRPDTGERALCLRCFDMFKSYISNLSMSETTGGASNSLGGAPLEFDVPWHQLDAYSVEVDRERLENFVFADSQLLGSAPEWNWWYMLKKLELKTLWPINAGTMHMELGTEFLSFSVLSSLVNEECLAAFMRAPSALSSY